MKQLKPLGSRSIYLVEWQRNNDTSVAETLLDEKQLTLRHSDTAAAINSTI